MVARNGPQLTLGPGCCGRRGNGGVGVVTLRGGESNKTVETERVTPGLLP